MLIENQNHLNKVDLESNSTQKSETVTRKSNRKQTIHKTDEIDCSNRYEALRTDDTEDEFCNSSDSNTSSDSSTSSDEISDEISSGNIQKKKKIEKFQRKGRKRKGRTKYCH